MPWNARTSGAFFRRCAFLFVALSVFWFGLHARLESYRTTASSLSDSKLATERHSSEALQSLDENDRPAGKADARLTRLCFSQFHCPAISIPVVQVASIELSDPRRLDLNGVYSLHGPPATTL